MPDQTRWRVKIGSSAEIKKAMLPPGIVSEVTELYGYGTWSVVMTTTRQYLPELLSRALALPDFRVFNVWESSYQPERTGTPATTEEPTP